MHCQNCGAQADKQARFCGSCGQSLLEPKTVGHADALSPTLESHPPPKPPPVEDEEAADNATTSSKERKSERKNSELRRKSNTMLAGYSAFDEPQTPVPQTPAPKQAKKTMLGMLGPGDSPVLAQPALPQALPDGTDMAHGKTMLGMQSAEGLAPSLPPAPNPHAPAEPAATAPARAVAHAQSDAPSDQDDGDEPVVLPGPRSLLRSWWLVGGGLLLFAIGVGAWLGSGSLHEVSFVGEYVWRDDGAKLNLQVDGADEGLKVAWKEQEVSVHNGRATLNLDDQDLAPGTVSFDIRWRPANRDAWHNQSVKVDVPFHVFADQERLSRKPPELRVVVRAPKGSKVTLDERVVVPSGDRFERVYTLKEPEPSDDRMVHHSRFTITTPEGDSHQGTHIFNAPVAYLQVMQPPDNFVTTKDTVVLRGKVHDGATVELDGTKLRLRNGLFHSLFRLQSHGKYSPTLTVRQEGFVPRQQRITIRRVDDLAQAARTFEADETIDYAALTERAETIEGTPVAFSGYVYHSGASGHDTSVQVLLKQCPSGDKCPAWVTYPAAIQVADRSWVEIRGYADGFQKFRTRDNKTDSIPRIRAIFLLPTKSTSTPAPRPAKKTRKPRTKRPHKKIGEVVNPW